MDSSYLHGSTAVWSEIWKGADKSYSEKIVTQNQLFEHQKILTLVKIFPKKPFCMLEVGCGTAFVSLYFAKRGSKVTCLDANKNILEIAKKNFRNEKAKGTFVSNRAEKIPFDDKTFDVVASFGLLEHFKDPTLVIGEMTRVLKPGGVFFADIVPNRFSVQTLGNCFNLFASVLWGTLKGRANIGWKKGIRNFRPLYFESSMTWREYKKIIELAGVGDLKVSGNRPCPRLTLPLFLDKLYTFGLKLFVPFWNWFDQRGGNFALFFGAGWWFWGFKDET